MNKIEEIKNKFEKDKTIYNFIKIYDEMCSNLQFKELIDVLELIQDDIKTKKQMMVFHLKNVFPDRDWDNEIDYILNKKLLG